jgi:xanthine dehydrogenase accessory factor
MSLREVGEQLLAAVHNEGAAALATVVGTWRSAPRPPGSAMFVTQSGSVVGSVSGGCIEAALIEIAQDVLVDGRARQVVYGVSDDTAFAVGLTCGGSIEVLVERIDSTTWPDLPEVAAALSAGTPVVISTVLDSPDGAAHVSVIDGIVHGSLGNGGLQARVVRESLARLESGQVGRLEMGSEGQTLDTGTTVFVNVFAPPARLLIFGAIDFSATLAAVGKILGYRVSVCDARAVFATPTRLPQADEVVVDWPHRWLSTQTLDQRSAVAVLTHDPKFDVPALIAALQTPAGYIGAMGSRRTHHERARRLIEAGVSDRDLARIHSPIGLDLGARTPAETAVSIVSEMILARSGGTGRHLGTMSGPIHHPA